MSASSKRASLFYSDPVTLCLFIITGLVYGNVWNMSCYKNIPKVDVFFSRL